jgi:hypothetical protein
MAGQVHISLYRTVTHGCTLLQALIERNPVVSQAVFFDITSAHRRYHSITHRNASFFEKIFFWGKN